ncbi:MAG: protein kinase [Gammaproteobacteria bacterium]|nr:protein kinase [Gammaproteobacteria bacterium]
MPVVDITRDILQSSSAIKARVTSHHPQHATLLRLVETMDAVDTSVQRILQLSYPEAYALALKSIRSSVLETETFVGTLHEKFAEISPEMEARMLAKGPQYSFVAEYDDQILFYENCVLQLLPVLNTENRIQRIALEPSTVLREPVAQALSLPPPPSSQKSAQLPLHTSEERPEERNTSARGMRVIPVHKLWIDRSKVLGRGGLGTVFYAIGTKKGNAYAVKEINPERISEKTLTALEEEAARLSKLDHENIVKFRGICFGPNYCSIVMEYVAYGSLYALLRAHVLTLQEQVNIMRGVAEALAYLHLLGMLHLDLKSLNILMKNGETPKLCDFGSAKEISASQSCTVVGRRAPGTARWKAPELWPPVGSTEEMHVFEFTEELDVYAFACVGSEVLTGKVPFEGVASEKVGAKVIQGIRPELPEGTDPGIAVLLGQCWDGRNTCRPKMGDVTEALKTIEKSLFLRPGS